MDAEDTKTTARTAGTQAKREVATRRAFYIWMAAYAAVIVVIALAYSFGGVTPGTTIDANGIRTEQAKVSGEPLSSIVGRVLPQSARYDVEG